MFIKKVVLSRFVYTTIYITNTMDDRSLKKGLGNMEHPTYKFDEVADKIFYPAYDEIIEDVIAETGITQGIFLDVGSGGGHLGFALMKQTDMQGSFLDIDEGALEIAKIRAKNLGFDKKSQIVLGNVENMPFEDGVFDLVISRGSVSFWKKQHQAFYEILRVMKPGAKAYIGGGLGSIKTQQEIKRKMKELGKCLYGSKKEHEKYSHALTLEEYACMFESMPCVFRIISDERHKRLILLEKT